MMNGVFYILFWLVLFEILYYLLGFFLLGISIIVGFVMLVLVVFGFDVIFGVVFGFFVFLLMVECMCFGFFFFCVGVVFFYWGLIQMSECFLVGELDVRISFVLCQINLVLMMIENRLGFCFLVCVLVSVVVFCVFYGVYGEVFFEVNCEDLGFIGLVLCFDCDFFVEYVKDKGNFIFFCFICV